MTEPKVLSEETIQDLLLHYTPSERKGYVQEHALTIWKNNNRRGTIESATGTGKTKIGVEAIVDQFRMDKDSLVYVVVPTNTLRENDWPEEFKKWGHEDILSKVEFVLYSSLHKLQPSKD